MLDRLRRSRRSRATPTLSAGAPATASVCMFRKPTVTVSVTFPDSRAPPRIGMALPLSLMPIRRLKKSSVCAGSLKVAPPLLLTVKAPAFSRKNGRFSGKNRLKRSRLICCWSTSTCAKSVLYVTSSVRPDVTPYLRSPPMSPNVARVRGTLANVEGEVELSVAAPVTLGAVLDELEACHPVLRGLIRDHVTRRRRAFVRFYACEEDLSHESPDTPLPPAVAAGAEPFLVVGAMAGG